MTSSVDHPRPPYIREHVENGDIPENLSPGDYYLIGWSFVRALAVAHWLGHNSASGLKDYVVPPGDWRQALVLDGFGATQIGARGEDDRAAIDEFVQGHGIPESIAEAVML